MKTNMLLSVDLQLELLKEELNNYTNHHFSFIEETFIPAEALISKSEISLSIDNSEEYDLLHYIRSMICEMICNIKYSTLTRRINLLLPSNYVPYITYYIDGKKTILVGLISYFC